MKLKTLSAICFLVIGVLLSGIIGVALLKSENERQLKVSQELRYESYLLADELRQSADDRTRLARTYVSTGDAEYERQYWDVLAIRNGEKPRGNGRTISLSDLMTELGFSDKEFAKLAEAQANSDGLVQLETVAMNAVKGKFADANGAFTQSGEPDLALARQLVHSPEYHRYKADIMRPVDEFFQLLDERTASAVNAHANQALVYMRAIKVLIGLTIVMFIFGIVFVHRRVLGPVSRLNEALNAVAESDDAMEQRLEVKGKDEFASVAQQFNRAVDKFSRILQSVEVENQSATRVRQALDSSSACIVIGDESDKIIYVNHAARMAIEAFEKNFQRYSPHFSAAHLLEANHSDLHPEPQGRAALKGLTSFMEESVEIDDFTFKLKGSPITGKTGERLGVITEWHDITQELLVERDKQASVQQELERAQSLNSKADAILDVVDSAMRGDLTRTISVTGDDVIGRMGSGVQALLDELRETLKQIGQSAGALTVSSETLASTSDEIGSAAKSASSDMYSVTATSDLMNRDVEQVAAAVGQMSSAIQSIASNAAEAARVAADAVDIAVSTDSTVRKLSDSSNDIGNVLKVITSIAEQTNLLALNATIEAARAGDAGKGFAVVANEVKELAKETARATEEIGTRIEAIQADSGNAVKAIGSINETINRINEIQTTIAEAVEEQTESTSAISRTMQNTADNSGSIANDISNVSAGMEQTEQGVKRLQDSARQVAGLADELRDRLGQFDIQ